jgi:hypothetical protein
MASSRFFIANKEQEPLFHWNVHTVPSGTVCRFGSGFRALFLRFFWPHVTAKRRCPSSEEQPMKDMQEHLDKLRADAAEFSMIGMLAADAQKREVYARLADHLNVLASEIARAIAARASDSTERG